MDTAPAERTLQRVCCGRPKWTASQSENQLVMRSSWTLSPGLLAVHVYLCKSDTHLCTSGLFFCGFVLPETFLTLEQNESEIISGADETWWTQSVQADERNTSLKLPPAPHTQLFFICSNLHVSHEAVQSFAFWLWSSSVTDLPHRPIASWLGGFYCFCRIFEARGLHEPSADLHRKLKVSSLWKTTCERQVVVLL